MESGRLPSKQTGPGTGKETYIASVCTGLKGLDALNSHFLVFKVAAVTTL